MKFKKIINWISINFNPFKVEIIKLSSEAILVFPKDVVDFGFYAVL